MRGREVPLWSSPSGEVQGVGDANEACHLQAWLINPPPSTVRTKTTNLRKPTSLKLFGFRLVAHGGPPKPLRRSSSLHYPAL